MPTDFDDLAYFGITSVQMNRKCWNRGVTFSPRTIFHFEQCEIANSGSLAPCQLVLGQGSNHPLVWNKSIVDGKLQENQ